MLPFLNQCYYSVNDFKYLANFYKVFEWILNVLIKHFFSKCVLEYNRCLVCGNYFNKSYLCKELGDRGFSVYSFFSSRNKKYVLRKMLTRY